MTYVQDYISEETAMEISSSELKRLCFRFSLEADEEYGQKRKSLIEQYNHCAAELNDRYDKEIMVIK